MDQNDLLMIFSMNEHMDGYASHISGSVIPIAWYSIR